MTLNELYEQLKVLNRDDKLQIMKFLIDDLGSEDLLIQGAEYPIYTPLGNEAAAHSLWEVLQQTKAADQKKPS